MGKKNYKIFYLGAETPPPENGRWTRKKIPEDFSGIEQLIKRMVVNVKKYANDPDFYRRARYITKDSPERDQLHRLSSLYNFLNAHIKFSEDPYDSEILHTPNRMLKDIENPPHVAIEDCDSIATLTATLIAGLGIRPIFIFGGDKENGLFHVWAGAIIPLNNGEPQIIHMDLSVRNLGFNKYVEFEITKVLDIYKN